MYMYMYINTYTYVPYVYFGGKKWTQGDFGRDAGVFSGKKNDSLQYREPLSIARFYTSTQIEV
jgi:hypothetical protein